MPIRYTPTPVPQDDNQPLRQWLDSEHRRIAASQEEEQLRGTALLYFGADTLAYNNATTTVITNYDEFSDLNSGMQLDPVAGTITMPNRAGLIRLDAWIVIQQTTAVKDFNFNLEQVVDGVSQTIGTAYIPIQSSNLKVAMSAGYVRSVTGGEVYALGGILDGTASATFDILGITFEIEYLTVRG